MPNACKTSRYRYSLKPRCGIGNWRGNTALEPATFCVMILNQWLRHGRNFVKMDMNSDSPRRADRIVGFEPNDRGLHWGAIRFADPRVVCETA
jgi:hypothetical protein